MKVTLPVVGLFLALMSVPSASAQAGAQGPAKTSPSSAEQEVITLSKAKWQWMAERNVDALDKLLAEEAVFVHMGATLTKSQELDTIKSGRIQYKDAQVQEVSVRFFGTTAILLNKIRLVAVVGGNEVVNPFNVTEVYVKQDGAWKLAALSFTRLMTPPAQ
jgi:4-carboxymuconolactone decarboxylase